MFVHSRTYGGYAQDPLSPEPFAYEYGFATKWLVDAQIVQIATGKVDPVAGNLSYKSGAAPWIAWGPYWWASGVTPCHNCQLPGENWARSDFISDGIHPSFLGIAQVASNLMSYYLNSAYAPWFVAGR